MPIEYGGSAELESANAEGGPMIAANEPAPVEAEHAKSKAPLVNSEVGDIEVIEVEAIPGVAGLRE